MALFLRAWYQTSDLAVVDAMCDALEKHRFEVCCFYSFSLRNPAAQAELLRLSQESPPDIVLTMQSFSICMNEDDRLSFLEQLGCPVLQVPVALCGREAWLNNTAGLPPAEVAMNVALPEIDGRVFSTVAGFKEEDQLIAEVQFRAKRLKPDLAQIGFIAESALRWAKLRELPNAEKKIAVILSNYPNRDGRIGNGVGLDTPASTVNFLRSLARGRLRGRAAARKWRGADALVAERDHQRSRTILRQTLSPGRQAGNARRFFEDIAHVIAGMSWTKTGRRISPAIFLLPACSSEKSSSAFSHPAVFRCNRKPFITARHCRRRRNISRFISGFVKSLVRMPSCISANTATLNGYRDAASRWARLIIRGFALGPLPHLYPFIVNNPGEGMQAKRRTAAVIIDHLTPPLTRAGLYDDLEKIERLLEEHAHCLTLYPSRAAELEREIEKSLANASWSQELPDGAKTIEAVGNFLCEIKESQIRSGLHVLGEKPAGEKEIDFLLSLLCVPSGDRPGLLEVLHESVFDLQKLASSERDELDRKARAWIADALQRAQAPDESADLQRLRALLRRQLAPRLSQCDAELRNLINGLNGKFVPPGPAGAPTRGRIDVLPTGRNFFTIDPRMIPTSTSWRCGKAMADLLLERHRQEHGEYPRKLALVVWGTSNMRTGGDDIAQALWFWGCEPVWEESSGRVVDFRILPLSLLGRPRVDVLLRVSGLFRDAFGETMRLLATIPKRLVEQDEPADMNPIRESWLRDCEAFVQRGATRSEAARRASLRVFSSEPGSYGTGLLPLIDAGNWNSEARSGGSFLQMGRPCIRQRWQRK